MKYRLTEKRALSTGAIKLTETFEKGFAALVLFLATGALIPMLLQGGVHAPILEDTPNLDRGHPVNQAIWIGVYAVTLILVFRRWRWFSYVVTRDKILLLLVGITLVSILWSVAPGVTLRRDIALIGTTLFGAYLASRFDISEQLQLLAWALGIATLLSLVFSLAWPSYGVSSDLIRGPVWQGVFSGGKNVLGRVMALSALVFLLLALGRYRIHRWVLWAGFCLSVSLLYFSQSVTSWATLSTLLLLIPIYATLRWRHTLVAAILVATVLTGGVAAMWLVANAEIVLTALTRDLTLSYRTDVWAAVLDMIWQRPWLGYGYGAFWLGWVGPSAQVWLSNAAVGIEAVHAHNGFLDLWLNLGLVGLTSFAIGFSLLIVRAVRWIRLTDTAIGLWPLLYSTFLFLYNLTESSILSHNNIFWILYVAVTLSMALQFSRVRRTGNIQSTSNKRARSGTLKRLHRDKT